MSQKKQEEDERTYSEQDPARLAEDFSAEAMARVIAAHADIDKTVAMKTARHYRHRPSAKTDLTGRTGYFGRGHWQADDEHTLHPEEKIRIKKQLILQQLLGGELGDIGDPPEEEPPMLVKFDFPVDSFIERVAAHRNVSVDRLEETFREQLEQAFSDMLENGEGHLPDFGVIRYGDGGPADLVFDINEELTVLFEDQED